MRPSLLRALAAVSSSLAVIIASQLGCGGSTPSAATPTGDDGGGGSGSSGGGRAGGSGSGGNSSGGSAPGASGCQAIAVRAGAPIGKSTGDTFTWSDAACQPRTAALVRNDATDEFGGWGGYARTLAYQVDGKTRTATGTGDTGFQGFGYVVDHYGTGSTAVNNEGTGGTYKTLLAGPHHAIHQYKWTLSPGGPVDVTVHWFFATGRSHPTYAITIDSTKAGKNTVRADSRSPYGDMTWEGTLGDVAGVGWGDKYRFTTTGAGPVTPTSPWDYTKANRVPYDVEWSTEVDAEMGLVQTQTFDAHIAGGDYGTGVLSKQWGKTGTNLLGDLPDWVWPYQLNQYSLPYNTTKSHRLAWGTSMGAVGQESYAAFGKTLSGFPFTSYSVFIVLGRHSTSAVDAQVAEIEGVQSVTMSASRGTVATDGPAGVARTDRAPFTPAGFDPVYGAWTVDAAANTATVSFAGGTMSDPIVVLRGYTASAPPSKVTLGGKVLAPDVDYFATVDAAGGRLWLTINRAFDGGTLTVD